VLSVTLKALATVISEPSAINCKLASARVDVPAGTKWTEGEASTSETGIPLPKVAVMEESELTTEVVLWTPL